MNKRKAIIFIVFILILLVIGIAIKIVIDFRKEGQIRNEVKEVTKVFVPSNIDDESINALLERRVITKGEYSKVEDSIKSYYKDLYSNLKNITFLLDEENEYNYLSSENLKNDSESLLKAKDSITNTKAQIDEYYTLFINYLTIDDTKLSYVADKNLSNYYIKFYLELTNEVNDEELKENLLTKYNKVNNRLDIYSEALTFLETNVKHWSIKKGTISFDSTEYYDDYIEITNKLNEEVPKE